MTGIGAPLTGINSLADLPLLGPMMSYVERTAADLGAPLWLREFGALVLLGALAYLALRLVVRRIFR